MKLTIWKYSLAVEDRQVIEMPLGAQLLAVQTQLGNPSIWALVDAEARTEERTFHTVGTGHPVPIMALRYIGTYQIHNGHFVGHVFEEQR